MPNVISATDGYSPAAASDPPTMAIDGAAESASAAQAAASARGSLRRKVMPAATSAGGDPCGQPDSKGANGPGASVSRSYACRPSLGEREQAPADDERAQHVGALAVDCPAIADAVAGRPGSATACAALPRRPVGDRHDREALRRPPQERVVVVLGLRRTSTRRGAAWCSSRGVGRVGDVEQRDLRAEPHALGGRVLADAEQLVLADRVQVGRVAEDLQLAAHARARRVGEVERVERIGLAERHDVAAVVDEAHRVDALAAAEAADLADLLEPARARREHGDVALALAARSRWSPRAACRCARRARTG